MMGGNGGNSGCVSAAAAAAAAAASGDEQGALDWVTPPATDAPCAEEYGCCNRNTDECSIDVSDFGEVRDTPEEVD
ncbi:hypothetical protein V498_10220 [Pseudogymnoascus sp. VKM F-4517 (FW-2822)]|nr:hypothetical protein V498_10220 [Pseudogymnoascus sp. VKM F-4517 (FW-2822)]